IKTLSYNISPRYSYPNPCQPGMMCPDYYRESKITGYQVSQTIQVTMRDLAKVGDLLEGLGGLEVQNVNGPSFALDDSTAGYAAARADAIGKAKVQAELLADQLGVRLGKIVNFSEASGGYPYPMMYGMGGDTTVSKLETPNIPTGENTYNASVSITYEIR
ncbi:MAG: SIMPL domain-containing protein, partial [bacterium]|nr:SIMPL domain-containing protein [bacterium]